MLAEVARRLPATSPSLNLGFARNTASAGPGGSLHQTRVGPRWVDPGLVISMSAGLAGFPALRLFVGIQLERDRFGPFQLLQSLDDARVAFLVFPDASSESLYDPEHILAACADEGLSVGDTAVLVIANARVEQGISLNLRAPILLETTRRHAVQHIMTDGDYPIRYIP